MKRLLLPVIVLFVTALQTSPVFSKNSSATKFKHYLGRGIAHPSDLNSLEGSPVGLLLNEGLSLSAIRTTIGTETTYTNDILGVSYTKGSFGGSIGRVSVGLSSTSSTASSNYYALGIKMGELGVAVSSYTDYTNTIGLIYGTDSKFRVGLLHQSFDNLDTLSLGLGLAYDFDKITFAVDAQSKDLKNTDNTVTTNIGVGLGYFGDMFLIGANTYSSSTSSDSAAADGVKSDYSEAFVGFATKNFLLRVTHRPATSDTSDDQYLAIALAGYF